MSVEPGMGRVTLRGSSAEAGTLRANEGVGVGRGVEIERGLEAGEAESRVRFDI